MRRAAALLIAAALAAAPASAQERRELKPSGDRPNAVCLDEAHHNVHTLAGTYAPFAQEVSKGGFRVVPWAEPFQEERLAEVCRVLVIAGPRGGGPGSPREDRSRPAFTPEEVAAVRAFVEKGGGLLLATDHFPIGAAAAPLAEAFGVRGSSSFTEDPEHHDEELNGLVFSRENGLLGDHPVTRGSKVEERVGRVATFLGQSLEGPPGSVSFLTLGPKAVDRQRRWTGDSWSEPSGDDPVTPAAGRSQGIALEAGEGRVVVLGESAMLTSRRFGDSVFGFELPGIDNRRLASNLVRWLAHSPGANSSRRIAGDEAR